MSCKDYNHRIQVQLGSPPLASKEFDDIKRLITNLMPSGIVRVNITFYGFLYLHQVYLQNGRYELVWKLVRVFGYNPILKQLPQRHQEEFSYNQWELMALQMLNITIIILQPLSH